MTPAEELVQLSGELGREDRPFAVFGEGNTSCDLGDGTFLVKLSDEDAEKIDRRLDEAYRRKMIGAKA